MERSGATIAFDYFKEKLLCGDNNNSMDGVGKFQKVRKLFEYIEDGDLWRWRLPNSKAFSSGLKDLNLDFDVKSNPSLFQQAIYMIGGPNPLQKLQLLSLDLDSVISQGMSSLELKQRELWMRFLSSHTKLHLVVELSDIAWLSMQIPYLS